VPPLSSGPAQVGELAGGQSVDRRPKLLVGLHGGANARFIFGPNVNRVRPPVQLHRQELPAVTGLQVSSACAVGSSAATQALDQRATHQWRAAEQSNAPLRIEAAALGLLAVVRHI
jgi:hypothetical protein